MREESDAGVIREISGQQGILGSGGRGSACGAGGCAHQPGAGRAAKGQQHVRRLYPVELERTPHLEVTAGMRYGHEQRKLQTQWAEALPPARAYAGLAGAIPIPGATALLPYDTFFNLTEPLLPLVLGATGTIAGVRRFRQFHTDAECSLPLSQGGSEDIFNRLMLYGSYTRRPQGRGFFRFAAGELLAFDEEEIGSFELGMKLDAWDSRLRVNAALFSMQYENMQLSVSRPHPDPGRFGSIQGVTTLPNPELMALNLRLPGCQPGIGQSTSASVTPTASLRSSMISSSTQDR